MVRNIVSVLVNVGRRKLDPNVIPVALKERRKFGYASAPPQGLYLADVHYDLDNHLSAGGRYWLHLFLYLERNMRQSLP